MRQTDRVRDQLGQGQVAEGIRKPARVLIADAHPIVREGLRELLSLEADIEIAGEVEDGYSLVAMVERIQPDIVVLDHRMPGLGGLTILRRLQTLTRSANVILFTACEDSKELVEAVKLGCSGVVLKHSPLELIARSIRKVRAGEIWLDPLATTALMQQFVSSRPAAAQAAEGTSDSPALTRREREIVLLVAQAYKNREIAEKLLVSEQTIKNRLRHIFDKLRVSGRLELALYAIHSGIYSQGRK